MGFKLLFKLLLSYALLSSCRTHTLILLPSDDLAINDTLCSRFCNKIASSHSSTHTLTLLLLRLLLPLSCSLTHSSAQSCSLNKQAHTSIFDQNVRSLAPLQVLVLGPEHGLSSRAPCSVRRVPSIKCERRGRVTTRLTQVSEWQAERPPPTDAAAAAAHIARRQAVRTQDRMR